MGAGFVERTRESVLRECVLARQEWERAPARNLVLLFDGTGNILGNGADTNVVKLLRLLKKQDPDADGPGQVVYYDPGVGTNNDFPPAGITSRFRMVLGRLRGLAEGDGAFDNVAEAYEFLCRTWRPGDRIFLFGFSRGAFTARAVGGMVNMYGLVGSSGFPLLRTLVRNYFAAKSPERTRFNADVVNEFSLGRMPLVHFTGVWDTVETIGLGGVGITNKADVEAKGFVHIRHALSIHETRIKYRPRLYVAPLFNGEESKVRSFAQPWFRGVHSDVGGAYQRAGLADVTLKWMIEEAQGQGLALADDNPASWGLSPDAAAPPHDQLLESPFWLWTGTDPRERDTSQEHESARPVTATTAARRTRPASALHRGLVVLVAVAAAVFLWKFLQTGSLAWDRAFLAAYAILLAYPMSWAARRWSRRAIGRNQALPWFARDAHRWMATLVVAHLLQNVFSSWTPGGSPLIGFFLAIKLLAAAWLALCLVSALFAPRND